jgi:hypothetical protein
MGKGSEPNVWPASAISFCAELYQTAFLFIFYHVHASSHNLHNWQKATSDSPFSIIGPEQRLFMECFIFCNYAIQDQVKRLGY